MENRSQRLVEGMKERDRKIEERKAKIEEQAAKNRAIAASWASIKDEVAIRSLVSYIASHRDLYINLAISEQVTDSDGKKSKLSPEERIHNMDKAQIVGIIQDYIERVSMGVVDFTSKVDV